MDKPKLLFLAMFSLMMILMIVGMILLSADLFAEYGFVKGSPLYFYYPPKGYFEFFAPFPFFIGAILFFIAYLFIFFYDFKKSMEKKGGSFLMTPIGFIAGFGSLFYLLSIILVEIQSIFGEAIKTTIPIGESSVFYYQLIYAPFIEELEFRIIPIGAYLLIRYIIEKRQFNILEVFIFPGRLLSRFSRKLDRYDLSAILITSGLFGFAHYVYGDWSITKIPQAALVGVILAFGFMLFGPFVDIPIHFLFDGAFTTYLIPDGGFTLGLVFVEIILMLLCAIMCFIMLLEVYHKRRINSGSAS